MKPEPFERTAAEAHILLFTRYADEGRYFSGFCC